MAKRNNRTAPPQRHDTWRAGCGESRLSGSEGGPQKPTSRNADRALRSDPYTYIATGEGWLYLASVLDLGSRRWLGYSMADHMRTELVVDALTMAAGTRGGRTDGIIFHGDRGSQYMSHDYRQQVADLGMLQSVGRTGVCWDNAVAESAWSSLKRELVHRRRFATRFEARQAIFAWINRYNTRRRHSSLGYTAPNEWETNYHQPKANPAA